MLVITIRHTKEDLTVLTAPSATSIVSSRSHLSTAAAARTLSFAMLQAMKRIARTLGMGSRPPIPFARAEVADEFLQQRLPEIFLIVALLLMFLLEQNECIVDGDIEEEPGE